MCIAILQKPGARVPGPALWEGWKRNSDGGGFAFVDPETKKVTIRRGFMAYNDFIKAYDEAVEAYPDSPFLIHMRVRTSGHVNGNNTHPFPVKGGAMIHNGTFFSPSGKYEGNADDRKSDTRVFAEHLFNILTYEDVVAAEAGILKAVGGYNKLAFLYDDGRYAILNEIAGWWDRDVWYSTTACFINGTKTAHPSLEPKK